MAFNRCLLSIRMILFVALLYSIPISYGSKTNEPDTFDYKDHPCKRSCKEGEPPKTCQYIFVVERYTTMSKACYDCPKNVTDCFRPHCIAADGVPKAVYSVNRQLPGPTIDVCENDIIEVELKNKMQSESTTLHWHGFRQLHTNYMDGVPYVTQCPILPGHSFTYRFHATTTGTFFYHSHIGNQKADGLFGALIVNRITEHQTIKKLNIHGEHIVVVNDWSYKSAEEVIMMDLHNVVPIVLDTVLVNGLGRRKLSDSNQIEYTPTANFTVTEGKNYRFPVIGAASEDCPIRVTIDQHEMKVMSLDSNDIEPVTGERIDFILEANQRSDNYWIRFIGSADCKAKGLQIAILRYDSVALSSPKRSDDSNSIETGLNPRILNPYNGGVEVASPYNIIISNLKSLESNDKSLNQKIPDHKIYISFDFYAIDNNDYQRRNLYAYNEVGRHQRSHTPQFNHISMKMPTVPLMSEWQSVNELFFCNAAHMPQNLDCQKDHCQCSHVIQLRLNSVVELILVDEGGRTEFNHPLHLHGHFFRVIALENLNGTVSVDRVKKLDESGKINRTFERPPLKDTMKTPAGGYTIVRFHANNPGYWFYHCHMESHMNQGMALIFKVGDHEEFPAVPKGFPKCGNLI